jgi:hypothetical protein
MVGREGEEDLGEKVSNRKNGRNGKARNRMRATHYPDSLPKQGGIKMVGK